MVKLNLVLLCGLVCVFQLSACSPIDTESEKAKDTGSSTYAKSSYAKLLNTHLISGVDVNYVAANQSIYQPDKVSSWASNKDLSKIREHAWRLWGGLTAKTEQKYPLASECETQTNLTTWDTWYSEAETFQRSSKCGAGESCREFHLPRQAGGKEVLSFNKYSEEFLTWVDENRFYDELTFININKEMDKNNTPTKDRIISATPPTSATMLKPTFWVVKNDVPVMIPYWKGPHLDINGSLTPNRPVASTWTNFVLFDPTGKADPDKEYPVKILGPDGFVQKKLKPDKVVNANDFYALPLTQSDVDYIKAGNIFTIGGLNTEEIKKCDLALQVGMHVTTAEFDNWTWQTFWWAPFPEDTNQPTVKAPFTNFNVATAYFFEDKNNDPFIAFNPYLETPIEGPIFMNPKDHGSHSNCMTCHHAAAYPTTNRASNPANLLLGSYQSIGVITGSEQWFQDRVKTRFMWGMLMEAQMQGKR